MKNFIILIMVISLISCNKKENKRIEIEPSLAKIDIYNNDDINMFVVDFLKNQGRDFNSRINETRFVCNKYDKDSLSELKLARMTSKKKLDSLISEDDWQYIEKQINDKKEFFVEQKYFKQKILNNDSIIQLEKDFRSSQEKLSDSFKLTHNIKFGERIYQNEIDFEQNMLKTRTPILYIKKPLFTLSRKRVIFSHGTYFGMKNSQFIISIFELKKRKWKKIVDLYMEES